jgi:hypothetical protein
MSSLRRAATQSQAASAPLVTPVATAPAAAVPFEDENEVAAAHAPFYRRASFYLYVLLAILTVLLLLCVIGMSMKRDATRVVVPVDPATSTGTSTVKRSALFCIVTHGTGAGGYLVENRCLLGPRRPLCRLCGSRST